MKDVIVLCVVLPLTLAVIGLICSIETNAKNENFVRETVYISVQQASRDGYFTLENNIQMKEKIADVMAVDKDDIKITSDTMVKYRPELINYKIEVPINKVVPVNKLFGITDKQNKGKIVVEGKIMSERLTP